MKNKILNFWDTIKNKVQGCHDVKCWYEKIVQRLDQYIEAKSPEEYEFLPDALEIVEKPVSPIGRFTIWSIFGIVIFALVWAYLGKIDMVASARGKVIPNGNVKVVQPFEDGVVTGIYVEEGQTVEKGELLISLDSNVKQTDVNLYEDLLNTLTLEKQILILLSEGKAENEIREKLEDAGNQYIIDLYLAQLQSNNSNLKILENQIQEGKINKTTVEDEIEQLKRNKLYIESAIQEFQEIVDGKSIEASEVEIIKARLRKLEVDEGRYHALYEAGDISKAEWEEKLTELQQTQHELAAKEAEKELVEKENQIKLHEMENKLADIESQIKIKNGNLSSAEQQIDELQNQRERLQAEIVNDRSSQILEKDNQIKNYSAQIDKAQQSLQYDQLYSPVDGTVYAVTVNTIGEVLKPAESVMTVVPKDTELVVEAMLLNKDIGFVEKGQEVIVKVDTFPFQKFGTISGRIDNISPNAYFDETNGYRYKLKIKIDSTSLNSNGIVYDILPGMEVTAEVKTGKRRIIEFFLEPFVKYLDESLKVR